MGFNYRHFKSAPSGGVGLRGELKKGYRNHWSYSFVLNGLYPQIQTSALISLRNEAGKNVRVATSQNNDLICEVRSMHTSYFLRHIETEGTFSEKLCLDHVNQVKEPRKVSYHQRLKLISPTALNLPHCFFFGIFQEKIFRKHRTQKSHLAVYDQISFGWGFLEKCLCHFYSIQIPCIYYLHINVDQQLSVA